MIRGYSAGTNPSPQEAIVLIGLGLVAIASIALWFRSDIYRAFQWLIRYPQHGPFYIVAQIAVPIAVIIVGLALIVYPSTGF